MLVFLIFVSISAESESLPSGLQKSNEANDNFTTQKIFKNSFSLNSNFQILSGNQTQENLFNIDTRYAWNKIIYDVGPSLYIHQQDYGSGNDLTVLAGAYGDYNLIENDGLSSMIYGPTIQFRIGQRSQSSSGITTTLQDLQLGAFVRWFLFHSPVSLRFEGSYNMKRVQATDKTTTLNGVVGQIFIVFAF